MLLIIIQCITWFDTFPCSMLMLLVFVFSSMYTSLVLWENPCPFGYIKSCGFVMLMIASWYFIGLIFFLFNNFMIFSLLAIEWVWQNRF